MLHAPATHRRLSPWAEKGKGIPIAGFIRISECNEWDGWDGENSGCTTENSLGGCGGGDKESWISYYVHLARFSQTESRTIGTKIPPYSEKGPREGPSYLLKVLRNRELFIPTHCPLSKSDALDRASTLHLDCCHALTTRFLRRKRREGSAKRTKEGPYGRKPGHYVPLDEEICYIIP